MPTLGGVHAPALYCPRSAAGLAWRVQNTGPPAECRPEAPPPNHWCREIANPARQRPRKRRARVWQKEKSPWHSPGAAYASEQNDDCPPRGIRKKLPQVTCQNRQNEKPLALTRGYRLPSGHSPVTNPLDFSAHLSPCTGRATPPREEKYAPGSGYPEAYRIEHPLQRARPRQNPARGVPCRKRKAPC